MSAPEFKLEITEPAEADIRSILSFTLQTWGPGQFADYRKTIENALNAIAENPQMGLKRHGLMAYSAGRHRIFYRMEGTTIYVLRILHNRSQLKYFDV